MTSSPNLFFSWSFSLSYWAITTRHSPSVQQWCGLIEKRMVQYAFLSFFPLQSFHLSIWAIFSKRSLVLTNCVGASLPLIFSYNRRMVVVIVPCRQGDPVFILKSVLEFKIFHLSFILYIQAEKELRRFIINDKPEVITIFFLCYHKMPPFISTFLCDLFHSSYVSKQISSSVGSCSPGD